MKRIINTALVLFAAACAAVAQPPTTGYTNFGNVLTPVNIDATNFVNLGRFNFSLSGLFSSDPFDFSDVLTFTNRGTMADDNGFAFDTAFPNQFPFPLRQPAATFVNANPGQIIGGAQFAINNNNVSLFVGNVPPVISVWATVMTNTGLLDVGSSGLISLTGHNLDLRRGTINVEGLGQFAANGLTANGALVGGQFVQDSDVGKQTNAISTNVLAPLTTSAPFEFQSPTYPVVTVAGAATSTQLIIQNAVFAAYTNIVSDSNIVTQVVIAGDGGGLVNVSVGFDTSQGTDAAFPVVHWQGVTTGGTGTSITNDLFLADQFGALTNVELFTNGISLAGFDILVPNNYQFSTTYDTNVIIANNTPYSFSLFAKAFGRPNRETNVYSALDLTLDSVTAQPDSTIPGSTYSNVVGRVEITADSLDLSNATLNAANFLNLNVSNFIGNPTANVSYSRGSLNLGNTNGKLTLTNLVPPTVPLFSGPIGCYSAFWTNITQATNVINPGATNAATNVFSVSNVFTVLMVSSTLQPSSPVFLQDLTLNSTNVTISDTLQVLDNFLINAQNITITTNGPGALSPYGLLELDSVDSLWTPYLPALQNLTNEGLIFTANNAFFETRHNLNSPSANDAPLQSFVNTGVVEGGGGNTIWANFFENVGPNPVLGVTAIFSQVGPIFIQSPTAIFANSETLAPQGDMQITAGALVMSNETLQAANSLILSATNFLTDLGTSNFWQAGDGFSALVLPSSGAASNSLRATTISNFCLPNVQSENVWAGRPFTGLSAANFNNILPAMVSNAPIGHLILNGGSTNSVFHFAGADSVTPYAMYVDLLDLEGGAVNRQKINGTNVFTALNVDPNVTIYFLDAVTSNNLDISEKLNGANGGRLIWVSNYVGQFSSVTITYPDANSFQFNRGLAQSLTIDSDGDGLVNGIDPTPFPEPFTASSIQLGAKPKKVGGVTSVDVSWVSPAYYTNTLQYRNMPGTNWLVKTNFVQGSVNGTVIVNDPATAGGRQYRVLMNPPQ